MHIPDNYLSPSTCAVMTAAIIPVWVHSVKKVKKELPKNKMPLLGVGAAFSFLMMMFNVPLPGGTTGHAVGGTLIALLLGPEAACISVSIALLLQALLFGDGGILAFGANCFNMAFVLPFAGYGIYKFIRNKLKIKQGENVAIVVGSYLGINIAALCAAIEFGIQPILFKSAQGQPLYCPYSLKISIPAMTVPHLLVAGVVEAVFTAAVYSFIKKVSPGTIYEGKKSNMKPVFALLAILILLTPLGLLATGTAWGEWGTDEISTVVSKGSSLGFIPNGMKHGFSFNAIMPDYSVSGIPESIGYIISAIAGAALLIIIFKVLSSFKKDVVNE